MLHLVSDTRRRRCCLFLGREDTTRLLEEEDNNDILGCIRTLLLGPVGSCKGKAATEATSADSKGNDTISSSNSNSCNQKRC
jgi:hypothetical protein